MIVRLLITLLIFAGCARRNYPCYEIDGAKLKIKSYERNMKNKLEVEALSFESMNLDELPYDLEEFKNLRYLNLRSNNLKAIPIYITTFSNLYALFIDRNPIRKLPDQIVNLKNLRVLTINGTEIESLPEGFYDLKLKAFLIGGSKINELQFKETKEKMKETKIIISVD